MDMDRSLPLWPAFTLAQFITIQVGQLQTQVLFLKSNLSYIAFFSFHF